MRQQGARLVRNPLRRYESDNLVMAQGEIGSFDLEGGADVIRCMNVFMYFDHAFRQRALQWAAGLLRPGVYSSVEIIGHTRPVRAVLSTKSITDGSHHVNSPWASTTCALRPIGSASWYALHDDDFENLCNAEAVGIIRSDQGFRQRFDERLDALLGQHGICSRGPEGYLGGAPKEATVAELEERSAALVEQLDSEGFVDDAVAVLRRAGRQAWRNSVGHVAMHPVLPHRLAPSTVLTGQT